jgi:hypothetical protein
VDARKRAPTSGTVLSRPSLIRRLRRGSVAMHNRAERVSRSDRRSGILARHSISRSCGVSGTTTMPLSWRPPMTITGSSDGCWLLRTSLTRSRERSASTGVTRAHRSVAWPAACPGRATAEWHAGSRTGLRSMGRRRSLSPRPYRPTRSFFTKMNGASMKSSQLSGLVLMLILIPQVGPMPRRLSKPGRRRSVSVGQILQNRIP